MRCLSSTRLAKRLTVFLQRVQERNRTHLVSGKGLAKHAEDCGIVSRKQNPSRDSRLFPFTEPFYVKNEPWTSSQVIDALKPLASEARLDKIEAVASARQFDVVPVIEGVYDRGNVAAVLRSADGVLPS